MSGDAAHSSSTRMCADAHTHTHTHTHTHKHTQMEPRHTIIAHEDHFANWKWNESRNLRLLYGSSGSFNWRVNNTGT